MKEPKFMISANLPLSGLLRAKWDLSKVSNEFEKGGVTVFIPVNLEEFDGEEYFPAEESAKIKTVIRQFFPNHYKK